MADFLTRDGDSCGDKPHKKREKLLTYERLWCIIKKMFVFGRSLLAPTDPREQHTEHAEDDVIRTEWVVMLRTATEVPHTAVAAP